MGIESGSSSFSNPLRPERPQLSREDIIIHATILDEEASKALFEANPVTWLRGAIGVDTQRGASEITDRELLERYVEGGRFEWDPAVAKSVSSYLKNQGFSWSL